jgi:transcriptional regulator with XRE-family HTH domain
MPHIGGHVPWQAGYGRDWADGLGERLRRQRVEAGLTQEELAQKSGLSARAISNVERGRTRRPRRSTLSQITAALEAARTQPD